MKLRRFVGVLAAAAAGVALTVVPVPASAGSATGSTTLHATGALSGGTRQLPSVRATAADLPTSVDLSQWAMPVGDQGQVGSCVPWAINYNMMGWYANKAGEPFAGAPMYVYSQIHANSSSDGGGSYPSAAYNVATAQGVDTQADYTQGNYDFTDLPTDGERANAAGYKMTAYSIVYNTYPNGPGAAGDDAIRSQIAAGHPVAITVPVYAAWDALNSSDWTLDANDINGGYRGTHEVVIFGYDAQGVRIENQWGTGWGQAGWANLDWNFIEQYSTEATVTAGLVPSQLAVPSSPTGVSAAANSTTVATLSWQPPTSDGGSTVTGYKVSRDGGTGWSEIVPATARSQAFALAPGLAYHLSVSAINAVGAGPVVSVPVTMPTSSLSVPLGFKIVGHKATKTATMSWKPPASSGGSPITGYKVARSGSPAWSKVVPATARSQGFSNLKVGVAYTLSVQAITANGTGPATSGSIKL